MLVCKVWLQIVWQKSLVFNLNTRVKYLSIVSVKPLLDKCGDIKILMNISRLLGGPHQHLLR